MAKFVRAIQSSRFATCSTITGLLANACNVCWAITVRARNALIGYSMTSDSIKRISSGWWNACTQLNDFWDKRYENYDQIKKRCIVEQPLGVCRNCDVLLHGLPLRKYTHRWLSEMMFEQHLEELLNRASVLCNHIMMVTVKITNIRCSNNKKRCKAKTIVLKRTRCCMKQGAVRIQSNLED